MYDVPPIGRPLVLRGTRDAAVTLDEFAPTHLDAWLGRAVADPAAIQGVPSAEPARAGDDVAVRAVVVRHGGDVAGRTPLFGARRRRAEAVLHADPPAEPLLGIVVEPGATSLLWLPAKDPALLARELSRAEWRSFTG
ncbi:MAG: hypothetical protein QOE45_703 [Frankiaceae bacterium]|jgi:hypothetical protein|nr:hypothetical protein [Frankiaceae bacterium]